MKKNWTKADCKRLREGNPGKVRTWIRDYADLLYTWILYHYAVDPSAAKAWIPGIFQGAYSHLETYDPANSSMYAWLIVAAESYCPQEKRQACTPALSEAQIASKDLHALAVIGSQEVPDNLLEHPAAAALIQAALTEMDESERLVLLRRYHRIDRKVTIGLDLGFTADLLGDQLVRARYYFRRYLFARIHSLQPEAGEFTPDTRITVFEKNLEKIFCSIAPFIRLPDDFLSDLETSLLQEAEQVQAVSETEGRGRFKRSAWTAGIVLLFLAAGIVVISVFRPQPSLTGPSLPGESPGQVKPKSAEQEAVKHEMSPEELEAYLIRVFDAGAAGDTDMLLAALERGPFPAQIASAIYLGRIGDASAIEPLEKAAQRWYPDAMEESPFLTAIGQIEQRLRLEAEQEAAERRAELEAEEAEAAEAAASEEPAVIIPATDPNLPVVSPPILPPEEVNEILIEDFVGPEPGEPNVFDMETWDPNDSEAEWPDEEIETDEIQYIDEGY